MSFLLAVLAAVQLSGTNARVEGEEIIARAGADGTCAFSLDVRFPEWEDDTYVMLPAGAYDGNRAYTPLGRRKVDVKPVFPDSLEWARGSVSLPCGIVDVEWHREDGKPVCRHVVRRKNQ